MEKEPHDHCDSQTEFNIKGKIFTVKDKIGEGGFSTVYKVENNGDDYVIKRMGAGTDGNMEIVKKEIKMMNIFKNKPHIVLLIAFDKYVCKRSKIPTFILLMEYCPNNLDEICKNIDKIDETYFLNVMYQISFGLSHLHYNKPPIIHRDIKPQNVLFNKKGQYVLCDFGSCTCNVLDPMKISQQEIEEEINKFTTPDFRCPEMINILSTHVITTKADIWALGCLLYQIIYKKPPFNGSISKIIDASVEFPESPQVSPVLIELISIMLTSDSYTRPNIYNVLEFICKKLSKTIPIEKLEEIKVTPRSTTPSNPKIQTLRRNSSRPSNYNVETSISPRLRPSTASNPKSELRNSCVSKKQTLSNNFEIRGKEPINSVFNEDDKLKLNTSLSNNLDPFADFECKERIKDSNQNSNEENNGIWPDPFNFK